MSKAYRAICLDLDGTVYKGLAPIPEAVDFIKRAQAKGIEPYFITNNSSMTHLQLQAKLQAMDIQAHQDRIMTSAVAAAKYCSEYHAHASILMIGEEGLEDALVAEGFQLTTESPDVVIMGIDRGISYAKLADACLAIRAGAKFLATNSDKAFPTERGLVPGNGSFALLMEAATGVSPTIIGKPETAMLQFIQNEGGYSKSEMVMVGDNYDTDIMAGLNFEIDAVHVETGVTSYEQLLVKERQPTHTFKTLAEWII